MQYFQFKVSQVSNDVHLNSLELSNLRLHNGHILPNNCTYTGPIQDCANMPTPENVTKAYRQLFGIKKKKFQQCLDDEEEEKQSIKRQYSKKNCGKHTSKEDNDSLASEHEEFDIDNAEDENDLDLEEDGQFNDSESDLDTFDDVDSD